MFYFSYLSSFIHTTYHFFESYHGQSAYDAAASHAKKQINETARDEEEDINDPVTISNTINTLKNYIAQPLPKINKTITTNFKTMNGIRSIYRYEFTGIGKIVGYQNSETTQIIKQYSIEGDLNLGEVEWETRKEEEEWEEEVLAEGIVL